MLHLADRWKARPDAHLLKELDGIRTALDQFGERLAELRGADRETVRAQVERDARAKGVKLVDRILELLLDGGSERDATGEDRRTVRSALGDIKRRYRQLAAVRETLDALAEDASFKEMLALRNDIAHARAGGRDFDALCVLQQLKGMLALLSALGKVRDAIEGVGER